MLYTVRRLLVALVLMFIFCRPSWSACPAPTSWFPETQTPEPDFHAPTSNCEFHQWAWQSFLWISQPTASGRIRLLDQPTAGDLFAPGRPPAPLSHNLIQQYGQRQPNLQLRVSKLSSPSSSIGSIHQALSQGVLVDANGQPIYYASHINATYYEFVRTNRLFIKSVYLGAPDTLNFPFKSVEYKSSWRVVAPGDPADGFFKTTAVIPRIKCTGASGSCSGDDIVQDPGSMQTVTVALTGLHIVGRLDKHPEFVWATFEHIKNAPDLPAGLIPTDPTPVSTNDFTFYRANTKASDCNYLATDDLQLDAVTGKLSPTTQVFRQFELGGGDPSDKANVRDLNASVHSQLTANSLWRNYFLVGAVWFLPQDALTPSLSGPRIQALTTGSIHLSNATMETFRQSQDKNCFSCHDTAADADQQIPPKNLNISHILKNGVLARERATLAALARRPSGPQTQSPSPLNSFQEVRQLLDDFVQTNHVPISSAPHRGFWNLDYDQFVNGNVPGVIDPGTGLPLKVLIRRNSANSNIILALRGEGPLFDPDNGSIGRMPLMPFGQEVFMHKDDIDRIASWIDRDCPR
jgi:hypothetical protein